MKEITLQEAFKLLQDCGAVIWGDSYLSYPSLDDLTGEEDNEFLYLSDQDNEVYAKFLEGANKTVKVSGCSMFLIDLEDDETQITLLNPISLE